MPDSFRPPADLDSDETSLLREYSAPLTALRRATQACPPAEVVQAAALESLPPDEQRRVAAHLEVCDACRALVEASVDPDVVETTGPSIEETARIWRRVSTVTGSGDSARASNRRGLRHWAPLAIAATLLLSTVLLGAWAMRLRERGQQLESRLARAEAAPDLPAPADLRTELDLATGRAANAERQVSALQQRLDLRVAPQVNVPILDLDPVDAFRSPDREAAAITVSPDAATIAIVLNSSSADPALPHALEIVDGQGRAVWLGAGLRQNTHHAFTLTVPRELLPGGAYRLRLFTERNGRRTLVETYVVRIQ